MKKLVNITALCNLMTLAAEQNYMFFTHTVRYNGYYCLFSVAMVKKDIPSLNLYKGDIVLTSPMVDNNVADGDCIVYKIIDIDTENGLFVPIISWALEFTKCIVDLEIPVYIENHDHLIEILLIQILQYENVNISHQGMHINLQKSSSWKSIIEGKIQWDDHDSLVHAENLIKNNVVELEAYTMLHAHAENIDCFRRINVSKGIILDW